jgi:hypothetical protein
MPGYSLVPVDYQPDFDGYSLVPVDYDPFAADGVAHQSQTQQAQAQPQGPPQQQPRTGADQPDAGAPAISDGPRGSGGYGTGPTGGVPNSDRGAVKAAPFGGYANPTPMDSLNGGPEPLYDENHMVDSYVYKKLSTGTAPAGPQVSAAKSNRKITATDGAKYTNFGGVYGHALTYSEPDSNNLATFTPADPTGLLVATPVEGDPSKISVREYKGY